MLVAIYLMLSPYENCLRAKKRENGELKSYHALDCNRATKW